MIEFLKHLTGFCGDTWHPNIWHALMGAPTITYAVYKVKNIFRYGKKKKQAWPVKHRRNEKPSQQKSRNGGCFRPNERQPHPG